MMNIINYKAQKFLHYSLDNGQRMLPPPYPMEADVLLQMSKIALFRYAPIEMTGKNFLPLPPPKGDINSAREQ